MLTCYTENDLIRYIYHETSTTESAEIASLLANDPILREEFESLQQITKELSDCDLQPDATSVSIVMEYSMKSVVGSR